MLLCFFGSRLYKEHAPENHFGLVQVEVFLKNRKVDPFR